MVVAGLDSSLKRMPHQKRGRAGKFDARLGLAGAHPREARPHRPLPWRISSGHLGYFDRHTCRLEPIDNPFLPRVLPMSPE